MGFEDLTPEDQAADIEWGIKEIEFMLDDPSGALRRRPDIFAQRNGEEFSSMDVFKPLGSTAFKSQIPPPEQI